MQHCWESPVMAIPQPQFGSLFHCLTTCTGRNVSLGASWAQGLSPCTCPSQTGACFHLPGCNQPFTGGRQSWAPAAEPVLEAAVPRSQQGLPAQGVPCCGLWAPAFPSGRGWTLAPWHQGHCRGAWCCCTGAAALPGQTVLLCLAQVELQLSSLGFPPRQSVRWIRDDLPLVNYITVNVSYITAAPPKIMAKILLTFWCCFMYIM